MPLFGADQWFNAGAVARRGAGLALDAAVDVLAAIAATAPATPAG